MQYVNSIEKWRENMKIERMILLGHSFGGYLSTAYTIKFPERIEHLILAGKALYIYFIDINELVCGAVYKLWGEGKPSKFSRLVQIGTTVVVFGAL